MKQLQNTDVLILCGGLGKRLRTEVGDSQKVMARINDRPFLDILLEYLKFQGFKRCILCVGYKADLVEQYYSGHSQGFEIAFSKEEEPLGTGGAIKNAREFVHSDQFFALNGDVFCAINYQEVMDFHLTNNSRFK